MQFERGLGVRRQENDQGFLALCNADYGFHREFRMKLGGGADHGEHRVAIRMGEQGFEHGAVFVAGGGQREIDDGRGSDRYALRVHRRDEIGVGRERFYA